MNECNFIKDTGLRGVEVASTRISDVKAKEGKLIYRGYLVTDLAENASFEEIVFLLLYEKLPEKEELQDFKARLKEKRKLPDSIVSFLKTIPADANPMDVLQAGIPLLAQADPNAGNRTLEAALESAEQLVSGLSVLIAAWERIRKGKEPVAPDESLDHSANFLYMLFGKKPDPEVARFFDTSLVLHAEHSFNASTFTARQVASTRAHIYASISAAVGSLSGELHGGANVKVMRMLQEIATVDKIDSYVNGILDSGGLIMGLGHAVYQVDDPSAGILAPMSKRVGELNGDTTWYELSKELEIKAKKAFLDRKKREIYVNVDFYSASFFYGIGIPIDFFSLIFALSRVSGWSAHVIEEQFPGGDHKPAL